MPATPRPKSLLAIEIGGTKLQLARGDEHGTILERKRMLVDPAAGASGIQAQIEAAVQAMLAEQPFGGVGVGFGGPINWAKGRVCKSHHVSGWMDFDLAGWLGDLTGAPVSADNDATVAAFAEGRLGAGRDSRVVFYTNQGTGVGGGVTIDGHVYHGVHPGEAELGHILLDRSGITVEQRCSGRAVDAKIRQSIVADRHGTLARLMGGRSGGEARVLRAALELGDPEARKILEETARDLAFGLSHVSHLFHPDVIVLGGGLSLIGEPWRHAVAQSLTGYIMDAHRPGPRVLLSQFGEDVVLVGGLLLAAECPGSAKTDRKESTVTCELAAWCKQYLVGQRAALESIPLTEVENLILQLRRCLDEDRQVFVFGNGGSAANASHFATDLGKGASDALGKRFRVYSLNDNVAWLSALGNDHGFENIFVEQLQNFARPGDLVLTMSVSGSSPNLVTAIEWAKVHGLHAVALVGGKRGRLAEIADVALEIKSSHYGHVEDAHMGIAHMLCYAFIEQAVPNSKRQIPLIPV